ncbi:MAG: hypothetical protein Q9181_002367 [Wetmoreana brouardii]
MSLKRHVCRFAATSPPDHIWINDEVLNRTLHRFTLLRIGRRNGSAVPGPLEARKRAAKRRMRDLAPSAGGPHTHPGFLAGLGKGLDNEQNWQWQSPVATGLKEPQREQNDVEKHSAYSPSNTDKAGKSTLPSWLADFNKHEDKKLPAVHSALNKTSNSATEENTIVVTTPHGEESKDRLHRRPEDRLRDNNDLENMRRVISALSEHDPVRKTCSRLALQQLLESECGMDRIMEFWADPALNPWNAWNLSFFIDHCMESSKVEEMAVFCQWMARQFYVGICPDRNLLQVLTALSRLRHQKKWRDVLEKFSISILQAFRTSPVVHIEDVDPRTCSSFLQIALYNPYSEAMLAAGMDLAKKMNPAQLYEFPGSLWSIIEQWINLWDPLRAAELSATNLSSKTIALLKMLPRNELLGLSKAISRHILRTPSSGEDTPILWQKQSIWWSAIRSPEIFPHIKNSDFWSELEAAVRRRQTEDIELMAIVKISRQVKHRDLGAARWTFLQSPLVTLESCPQLAEALIRDPVRDWNTAFVLRESRQDRVAAKLHSMRQSHEVEQLQHDRTHLLERMASAYAQARHLQPSVAFQYVYDCWTLHKRDVLGPVGPDLVRALVHSGLVRPLQAGQTMSYARLEWILRQVAEVEGEKTMRRLGQTVWQWREDINTRSQSGLEAETEDIQMEQERVTRLLVEEDPYRWDALMEMATARTNTSSSRKRHEGSVRVTNPATLTLDTSSSSIAPQLEPYKRQESPQSTASLSLSEQPSCSLEIDKRGRELLLSELPPPLHEPETRAFRLSEHHKTGSVESTETSLSRLDVESSSESGSSIQQDDSGEIDQPQHPFAHLESDSVFFKTPKQPNIISSVPNTARYHTDHVSVTPQPPAPSVGELPYVPGRYSRDEAMVRHARIRELRSLLDRLNKSRLILVELLPHAPCSLTLAVRGLNIGQRGRLDKWRPVAVEKERGHGMKDYDGPMTVSSAMQPALGKGLAGRGERRLDLGSGAEGLIDVQGDGDNAL